MIARAALLLVFLLAVLFGGRVELVLEDAFEPISSALLFASLLPNVDDLRESFDVGADTRLETGTGAEAGAGAGVVRGTALCFALRAFVTVRNSCDSGIWFAAACTLPLEDACILGECPFEELETACDVGAAAAATAAELTTD